MLSTKSGQVQSGVCPHGRYDGENVYDGAVQSFRGIKASESRGLIVMHQDLALIPLLSVAENIFLGNERVRGDVIDWRETERRAGELLRRVGLPDSPKSPVATLGLGKQQLVQIAKALSNDVRLLILDEPSSSLNEQDSEKLLALPTEFREQGVTSILISHKLNEIREVADTITVLRDEPTRGIDMGEKFEIYTAIRHLAEQEKAAVVISSEMPELPGITDRLYVMNEGRFAGEMPAAEASQEKILARIIESGERRRSATSSTERPGPPVETGPAPPRGS